MQSNAAITRREEMPLAARLPKVVGGSTQVDAAGEVVAIEIKPGVHQHDPNSAAKLEPVVDPTAQSIFQVRQHLAEQNTLKQIVKRSLPNYTSQAQKAFVQQFFRRDLLPAYKTDGYKGAIVQLAKKAGSPNLQPYEFNVINSVLQSHEFREFMSAPSRLNLNSRDAEYIFDAIRLAALLSAKKSNIVNLDAANINPQIAELTANGRFDEAFEVLSQIRKKASFPKGQQFIVKLTNALVPSGIFDLTYSAQSN